MTDSDLMAQTLAALAVTADLYPGVVIVGNLRTQSVEYMSTPGLQLLGTTLAELRALGPAYHTRYFNAAEAQEYLPKIQQMLTHNDPALVVSFFQQVRLACKPGWSWYFTTARLLLQDTQGQPLLILCLAAPVEPAAHLAVPLNVDRLYAEDQFLRRQAGRFAELTPREREVLRALAQGQSTPAIAAQLFLSPLTVDTHRRNLRRKLGVDSTVDMVQFARAFDLI